VTSRSVPGEAFITGFESEMLDLCTLLALFSSWRIGLSGKMYFRPHKHVLFEKYHSRGHEGASTTVRRRDTSALDTTF